MGERVQVPTRTIAEPVRVGGPGLYQAIRAWVVLRPRASGEGIWLRGPLGEGPVHVAHASTPGSCTAVHGVRLVEHLLAAVATLGITDLEIEASRDELPLLDGSAAQWLSVLGEPVETGRCAALQVREPVRVAAFGGVATAHPAKQLVLEVEIDFGPALRQRYLTDAAFPTRFADARTFVRHEQLDAFVAAGVGPLVPPGSVVVWGPRGPLVPLRYRDEPARHKAVDLLGDLVLLGAPLRAHVHVERGSHALHHELVRALLAAGLGDGDAGVSRGAAPPPSRSG